MAFGLTIQRLKKMQDFRKMRRQKKKGQGSLEKPLEEWKEPSPPPKPSQQTQQSVLLRRKLKQEP